ncbi:MAG: hypothetical protein K6C94_01420 [Candidatus Gastranaerophilales bacterium]|nr:hypothetical protein [Candidatus Gastranaerophilales bacterium]
MKKFLKIVGILFLVLFVCLYFEFLFVFPDKIDLNKYKPALVAAAKREANLNVDFSNVKLVTTPFFAVGIKIDDLKITLPDNSLLFSADSIKTDVSMPNTIILALKVSDFDVERPVLNLEIKDNRYFKVVKLIEDIINDNKQKQIGKIKEEPNKNFDMSLIRIIVPKLRLYDYKILIRDLSSKHYLEINGDELTVGYFNGKRATIKGDLHILSDTKEKVTANFDINTFLPQSQKSMDEEDDEAMRVEFPFVNPVELYQKYDLQTALNTKLKIKNKKDVITTQGFLNIDGLSLKVEDITLPPSYLHAVTNGQDVQLESELNITEKAKINLFGSIVYGKNPKTDITVKTGKVYFQDLLNFAKALLNSLGVPNELGKYTADGSFEADTYIKTNFKKLKSNGSIVCENGELSKINTGKIISDANIKLMLDDDILDIQNSSFNIQNSKVTIDGSIDNSSYADISVKAEPISLPFIFNAFAPQDIKDKYALKSGELKTNIFIRGKLKDAVSNIEITLKNLIFADTNSAFQIENDLLESKLLAGQKTMSAGLINDGLKIILPQTQSNISVPKLEVNFADNNIDIRNNTILLNNNTKLTYAGHITDITEPKDIQMALAGDIDTKDAIQLLGKENEKFFQRNGQIPFVLSLTGNHAKQTLSAEFLSDENNFLTPIDFDSLRKEKSALKAVIDFKANRFKIKKTGLFKRVITTDDDGNEQTHYKEIIGIDGTIAGDTVNLLQISIPKHLKGHFCLFPKSDFTLERSRLLVYGKTAKPRINGALNVLNLSIPELLTTMNKLNLKFSGQKAEIDVNRLTLNNSDINLTAMFKFIQSGIFAIEKITLNSKIIDIDNIMKVSDAAAQYFPPSNSKKTTSEQADIPLEIQDCTISIDSLRTGNIQADTISSKMFLKDNILSFKDINTQVFRGSVNGDVDVNLLNSDLKMALNGDNINVEKAMADAAGIKGTLSGTTDFTVNLSMGGSTYEQQMKSLKGSIVFEAQDGQYGPFAKLENLIIAENIRESEFFQSALGGIIGKLTTIDTTHYERLAGKISFDNGICNIEEMTSRGSVLMMHIFGQFDLLNNTIDMKVRAKMTSLISEMLGPISAINPIKLVNSAAGTNVVTAKAFSLFCETLDEEEINKIPSFSDSYVESTSNANRFQLVAKGDVAKPLTLIKSFKWITTPVDFQKAKDFVASIPNPVDNNTEETIEEAFAEQERLEKEKKTLMYKVKHIFQKKENEEG